MQLPGIELVAGITIVAPIGDIARFPTVKHLVGFSGLGARVHDSGQTHHGGVKLGRECPQNGLFRTFDTAGKLTIGGSQAAIW